jgi:hypothetical protein
MAYVLLALTVAFAAFSVWLTVRIINRRETWAKWTAAVLPFVVLVGYAGTYAAMAWGRYFTNTFGDDVRPSVWYGSDDLQPYHRTISHRQHVLRKFFQPAHWIDQRLIRPGYWAD